MTPKKKPRVSEEDFNNIVTILEKRAQKFIHREASVGHSSRVTGYARISDEELHSRLARLRNHVHDLAEDTRQFGDENQELIDIAALLPPLDVAGQALGKRSFVGLHKATIWKRLMMMRDAIEDTLDLIEPTIARFAVRIAPDCPLHLLTPEELETAFDDVPDARLLAGLLNVENGMRNAIAEIMALLKGYFYDASGQRGPYEQRRGRWIAAHLLGLAEGLGLDPTRNTSPTPHIQPHGAADAVAIVIGRLLAELRIDTSSLQQVGHWRSDPAARAILVELPRNRGEEFDAGATANTIIRKLAYSEKDYIVESREMGRHVGQRDGQKKGI